MKNSEQNPRTENSHPKETHIWVHWAFRNVIHTHDGDKSDHARELRKKGYQKVGTIKSEVVPFWKPEFYIARDRHPESSIHRSTEDL